MDRISNGVPVRRVADHRDDEEEASFRARPARNAPVGIWLGLLFVALIIAVPAAYFALAGEGGGSLLIVAGVGVIVGVVVLFAIASLAGRARGA